MEKHAVFDAIVANPADGQWKLSGIAIDIEWQGAIMARQLRTRSPPASASGPRPRFRAAMAGS